VVLEPLQDDLLRHAPSALTTVGFSVNLDSQVVTGDASGVGRCSTRGILRLIVLSAVFCTIDARAEDAGTSTAADAGWSEADSSEDGGSFDAGGVDSGAAATSTAAKAPPTAPVVFRGRPIILLSKQSEADDLRAKRASEAFSLALAAEDEASIRAPAAEARRTTPSSFAIYVRGHFIVEVTERDAFLNRKQSLEPFARDLEADLRLFVADQRRRAVIQRFAISVLSAVLVAVAGLFLIRLLRSLFDRLDAFMDDQRIGFQAIRIFRVPIASKETVSGAIAFALALGRAVSYLAIALGTVALFFWQFDSVRPIVRTALARGTAPLVAAFQSVLGALPGIVVAVALIIGLRAALRVMRLLLGSMALGHTTWRHVTPQRVPVLRLVLPIALVILAAPVIIAAAFGRFNTPLETLSVIAGGVVAIACVPLVASGCIGLVVLWRGAPQIGEHISLGRSSGIVDAITPWEIIVAGADGTRTSLPMLLLLFMPLRNARTVPRQHLYLVVPRDRAIDEARSAIEAAAKSIDPSAELRLAGLELDRVRWELALSITRQNRERLLLELDRALGRMEAIFADE
jgi:hypothetical protein